MSAWPTYGDVKNSPTWEEDMPNANQPLKNFELALAELIDDYRGKITKEKAIDAIAEQAQRVEEDQGWRDPQQPAPVEEDGAEVPPDVPTAG